jgi:hypothetical protein
MEKDPAPGEKDGSTGAGPPGEEGGSTGAGPPGEEGGSTGAGPPGEEGGSAGAGPPGEDGSSDAAGGGTDGQTDRADGSSPGTPPDQPRSGDRDVPPDQPRSGDRDVPPDQPRSGDRDVPPDVDKYARFQKVDGAQYDRVNEFLRDRTYITAREWAIARLCADFRTETGVEMTKIGEHLPELVPFMTDTYSPQAVNQARASFEEKVRMAGATFLYGAMCDFFTAEELDEVMYEVTEVAKFLLEVEGVDLAVEEELEAEERISSVMREVRNASAQLREEELADAASD